MKTRALGAAACLAAFVANLTPAVAFTMDDVLSAPYISNLTASADGTAIAWAVHVKGRRNLYAYANGKIIALTKNAADDGQQVSDVQFLPSNDAVVYVHGGEDGNIGDNNPNPIALASPPERTIELATLSGETAHIGTGHSPAVSPKGDLVVWISHGAVQSASLSRSTTGYAVKANPAPFKVAGSVRHITFSPDGSRIAFVNARGNHSFIGVYTFGAPAVTYARPDFSNDSDPAWSPDGSRIAFLRTSGEHEAYSPYEAPEKQPWSIWIANAQTGDARRLWQAPRGMGSEYYYTPENDAQLFWMPANRIAFTWERTGWNHLYSLNVAGATPRDLTPGNFEVERVTPALDRSAFLIASNRTDIDRRHVSFVNANGGVTQITSGARDQWQPVSLANGKLAYVDAGYKDVPTVVDTAANPQRLVAEATPAQFPASDLVEPKLITFKSTDGWTIHGELFVPKDWKRTHPALIFNHGGPPRQMLPGFHYMEAYTNLFESNEYYANHGFVVLSINYRLGIMYGHNFREPKLSGPNGAREYYRDVLAGAHYLMQRPDVNPNKLGIYGLSYGGYLAAMGLAHNSNIFKAAADFAGVHNWATLLDNDFGQKVGTRAERAMAYKSSPVAAISTWRSPVFLAQGDDDRNVAFSQGVDLAWRLRERNIPVETMVFPNETHENLVYAHMLAQFQAAADFLIAHLK